MTTLTLRDAVREAVAAVDDPEFPGVSITDLGMLEAVRVDPASARTEIDLVPTFLGCPALEVIALDVRLAAEAVAGTGDIEVRFVAEPQWTTDRISARGRRLLADEFTVAVPRHEGGPACPVCSADSVEERSPFGPTACRAISYCASCRNPVEVMRR